MDCEEIRNLVLTDYIDEQLSARQRKKVLFHLAHCRQCREFAVRTGKAAVEPFSSAERKKVPPAVWEAIKENIAEDRLQRALAPAADRFAGLKAAVFFSRRALTCAAAVALFIIAMAVVNRPGSGNADREYTESMEYVAYLMSCTSDISNSGYVAYGMPVEQYVYKEL